MKSVVELERERERFSKAFTELLYLVYGYYEHRSRESKAVEDQSNPLFSIG